MNIRTYVSERHGVGAPAVLAKYLDASTAEHFLEARWSEWYPAVTQSEVLVAYDKHFAKGDLAAIPSIGAHQCARDLASPLGLLFRIFKPVRLLRHMDVVWRRFHDTGYWLQTEDGGVTTMRLHEWRGGSIAACHVLRGYLERLAREVLGTVRPLVHEQCAFRGGNFCEYRLAHRFGTEQPLPFAEINSNEIPIIGRELAQLPSLEATVDAIVALVRGQFPVCDAALFLPDPDDANALRAAQTIGRLRSNYRHQWILESRGLVVGRLAVHADCDATDARVRTIAEFVPWFGLALAGITPPREGAYGSGEWQALVAAASEEWSLTPRQRDVLGRIVRGESNRQIGFALGCAEATIEVHVSAILKKANASGRAQLVSRVAERQLGGASRGGRDAKGNR